MSQALAEFKKDKISRQNARLSLVNSVYDNPSIPRRKILLSTGSTNYKPPLERSKSAPKLTMIEENLGEEDEDFSEDYKKLAISHEKHYSQILRYCGSTTLTDKSSLLKQRLAETSERRLMTHLNNSEDLEEVHRNRMINFDREEINQNNTCDDKNIILEDIAQTDPKGEDDISWFQLSTHQIDLLPFESENTSLTSSCESNLISDNTEKHFSVENLNKNEPEFKLGGNILSSIDRLTNCTDVRKYCGIKHSLRLYQEIPDTNEVSLIPVGETYNDFSSLKVFKKRSTSETEKDSCNYIANSPFDNTEKSEEESACSDESGYDENIDNAIIDESPSPISKIILV